MEPSIPTRRRLLGAGLAAVASGVLAACTRGTTTDTSAAPSATGPAGTGPSTAGGGTASSATTGESTLAPTPACVDDDDPTPAQTAGPYFTPNSPEKSNLAADVAGRGTAVVLSGTVVTTDCRPVDRALVDLWHADDDGEYDDDGYRLRGHVFTDAQGRYRFETIVPGIYPGRTRHYHVKVQAPNGPVLTTQLYFPGEAQNARDRIFREECLLAVNGSDATFRFVLEA